jgi:Trehalase
LLVNSPSHTPNPQILEKTRAFGATARAPGGGCGIANMAQATMRNPLYLRNNPGETEYVDTYVESSFAEENPFRAQPRRNVVPWPAFEYQRANVLPAPHWPGHPSAIDCYWRCWEIAFSNFRPATEENGFVSDYSSTMYEDSLYMWDSVFIALFGRYGDRGWKFQDTLDNFYGKQHPDGGICRQFREGNGSECYSRFDPAGSGPNVLGLAEWQYYLTFGDLTRLERVFPALVAYGQWLRRYRTWPNGSYWGTGRASGMDNQPRTPEGRSIWFDHAHGTWVDTNMQAVLANRIVLDMAAVLGRKNEVQDFADENEALIPWINANLWDDSTGFYHDLRRDQSRLTELKTIGAYWALLADAVPPERLERFVQHLSRPTEFKRAHRIPSLSADTPGYDPDGGLWLGGVWPPTNYMVMRGLSERGFEELAYEIAKNHYDSVIQSFEETGSVWEHHAPDQVGEGRGRTDFVGWTGITPIAVLFEYIFGLRPDFPKRRLVWQIRGTEEFGVRRYPFGGQGLIDLTVFARSSLAERPHVAIESNIDFEVELRWMGGTDLIPVTAR